MLSPYGVVQDGPEIASPISSQRLAAYISMYYTYTAHTTSFKYSSTNMHTMFIYFLYSIDMTYSIILSLIKITPL